MFQRRAESTKIVSCYFNSESAMPWPRLFDWKRAKGLPGKFQNANRQLQQPLSHLPDATGVKYQLQSDLHRYSLQKYYSATVASMFIVRLHPEHATPGSWRCCWWKMKHDASWPSGDLTLNKLLGVTRRRCSS